MAASKAILHSILLVCCISIFVVHGRILKLNSSDIDDQFLISDGVDHHGRDESKLSMVLGAATCNPQYGFLPCAENILGYIFLIIVYQILLKLVDEQTDKGSKELFNRFGETKVGHVIYRFLKALPLMIFLILSGVLSSKENAQSTVSVGVGIFAGITVFTLTVQWGLTLIQASRKLPGKSDDKASTSSCLPGREQLINLKDNGVLVYGKTRKTGGIMLISLIPYAIVQLAHIFGSSSANRVITLVALIVSLVLLVSYFIYQIGSTWMQDASLAHVKDDIKKERLLEYIQQDGRFLTDDGEVDTDAIRNVFAKADTNQDKCLRKEEVEKLVRDCNESGDVEVENVVEMIMKFFDKDNNRSISEKEFIDGCTNWLTGIRMLSPPSNYSSLENLADEVVQSRKKKREEADRNKDECIMRDEMQQLMLDHIKRGKIKVDVKRIMTIFGFDNNGLITEKDFVDGWENWLKDIKKLSEIKSSSGILSKLIQKRDEDPAEIHCIMSAILTKAKTSIPKSKSHNTKDRKSEVKEILESFFNQLDSDRNKSLSKPEMLELVKVIEFEGIHREKKEIVDIIFQKLDLNRDGTIDELEFVNGISKLTIVEPLEYSTWILLKSSFRVISGLVITTLLGGPLINNILSLSYAMGVPSFGTSYVMVPIILNIGALLAAIWPAKEKVKVSATLEFSQIYGLVIMNNITGLTSLLSIVYLKGLTWDFSAEVGTNLFVCAIMGVMAYKRNSYPLWTWIAAFALYPVSFGLYYLTLVF